MDCQELFGTFIYNSQKKAADTNGLRPQIAVERLIDYARRAIYP